MKNTALELEINPASPAWSDVGFEGAVRPVLTAAVSELGLDGITLSVLLTDDEGIRALNAEFRGKDLATNVLSWPAHHFPKVWDAQSAFDKSAIFDPEIGDTAFAFETITKEAQAADLSITDHLAHLALHGMLHCLGFDHETDATAAYMEGLERKILAGCGLHDPYIENTRV